MAANDRQEGGTHYQQKEGVPQHWDLSIMYGWDGFQHCITKYVMRWKTKYPTLEKQIEDLRKARHMLDKYIEEAERGTKFASLVFTPRESYHEKRNAKIEGVSYVPPVVMPLVPAERVKTWRGFTFEGAKKDDIMYQCDGCGAHVTVGLLDDPITKHGACAGRDYVAQ
jgi:hypothetical protein